MEERPKNLNPENLDDEDEEEDEKDKKTRKKSKLDFIEELANLIKGIEEKDKKEDKELASKELEIDTNPELDSEAPVEHLSEVEIEDISRTLARERMDEILIEDANPENESAKEFLDQVIETGDISFSESEIITAPILPVGEEFRINDPDSVGRESVSAFIHHEKPDVIKKEEKRSEKIISIGILDYLIDRRKIRIDKKSEKKKDLDKKLDNEVDKLRIELAESERRVRVEAANDKRKTSVGLEAYPEPELQILRKLEKNKTKENRSIEKPVAVMSKDELSKVAQNIKIDGTSLKQVFDSHLISEKGLRRIVSTFLRGGNIKRALNREILQRQVDFEKDPILRDSYSSNEENNNETFYNESVDVLLQKRGIDFIEPVAFRPMNTIPKKQQTIVKKQIKKIKLSDLILILIGLILLLLMLVILL